MTSALRQLIHKYLRQYSTRRQTAIAEGKMPTEQVKAKSKRPRSSTSQRKAEKYCVRVDVVENDVKEDTQQGYKSDDQANQEKHWDGEDGPASKKLKTEETEEAKGVYKVGKYHNMDWLCACC